MIKRLGPEDKQLFENINCIIKETLSDVSFLIPFTEEEIVSVLSKESNDIALAIKKNEEICAISCLVFDTSEFVVETLGYEIDFSKSAEIGGCMTLPDHRAKGYMYRLNTELIRKASLLGVRHIFATAHPDNIASNKSLIRLGMKFIKEFDRHGYKRNLYLMAI